MKDTDFVGIMDDGRFAVGQHIADGDVWLRVDDEWTVCLGKPGTEAESESEAIILLMRSVQDRTNWTPA